RRECRDQPHTRSSALQLPNEHLVRGRGDRQNCGPVKCRGDKLPRRHDSIAVDSVKENGIASGQIIRRKPDGSLEFLRDSLTVEEPLEIRIGRKTLATTMRTPGHDDELAAGFLLSEGIVRDRRQIVKISADVDNIVTVDLVP